MKNNVIPSFSKNLVIVSSIFIAILLISTTTAVPQVHGSIVSKKIEKIRMHNVFPNLVDLKDKDLVDKVKENLQLLTGKICDKLKNLTAQQGLSREEKERVASKVLVFLDEVLENKDNLRSSALLEKVKEKLNKGETSAIPKARLLLQSILQYLDKYSKKAKGELLKITNRVKDDARKMFSLLDELKSSGKEKLVKPLKNILLHYNSEEFSKIKNLINGNWTKIIILLILAIVAILVVIGILIFFLPFLAPLIQLFLIALAPLLALLAIAITAGGIVGLALIVIGLIFLLIAFIGGLNLAMAIIFAIIILVVIAMIILSIALTTLGLFVAAIGCIIGGIIAASPILLPILLVILSIAIVINIALGGAILGTIYGLLEKYAPSIAESIKSLCETLYNIPILGPILAFLLPGLPWPEGGKHKKFLPSGLTLLVTFLMQKITGKNLSGIYSTV